jgi:sigma-B regulation protein RsbU (phosphoserine phosphatase)
VPSGNLASLTPSAEATAGLFAREGSSEHAARILVDDLYAFEFPLVPGIEIGASYRPAADRSKVGGDLIDVYQFNNGSVAISIADISGKGIHAAIRAASVKHALRAYVSAGFTPAQVMRHLNLLYIESSRFEMRDSDSFVSVFLGIADPERRVLTYASAGHEPVFLFQNGEPPLVLPPTGPVVGIFEEWYSRFHQRLVSLEPLGSTLMAMTDGITEARSPDGAFFYEHPMMDIAEENRSRSAHEQAQSMSNAALAFSNMEPHDDIAIVVARFLR